MALKLVSEWEHPFHNLDAYDESAECSMENRLRHASGPVNSTILLHVIGTKSMQNTSAYEEPRSSGKWLHEYQFL